MASSAGNLINSINAKANLFKLPAHIKVKVHHVLAACPSSWKTAGRLCSQNRAGITSSPGGGERVTTNTEQYQQTAATEIATPRQPQLRFGSVVYSLGNWVYDIRGVPATHKQEHASSFTARPHAATSRQRTHACAC